MGHLLQIFLNADLFVHDDQKVPDDETPTEDLFERPKEKFYKVMHRRFNMGPSWIWFVQGTICLSTFITYWFVKGDRPLYDQWMPTDNFLSVALGCFYF